MNYSLLFALLVYGGAIAIGIAVLIGIFYVFCDIATVTTKGIALIMSAELPAAAEKPAEPEEPRR
jgi:hypothetical protein